LFTPSHFDFFILTPNPSLLRKEGAIHRYAEHYESIPRNKIIFIFHYTVLRSYTNKPLLDTNLIIISEFLLRALPSLRSREGMGVS
jgi:hypothetical protein